MERYLVQGARLWRSVAGERNAIERFIKRKYRHSWRRDEQSRFIQHSNQHYMVIQSKREPEPRAGILLRGGCDLPSMFLVGPLIRDSLRGTIAIARPPGFVGASHSRQLLQTLRHFPEESTRQTIERLKLPRDYFKPVLFEGAFGIEGRPDLGRFPTKAIVLSIGTDLTRPMHRHREHGYLVDIGGWWLNQTLDKALKDLSAAEWFKKTFEPAGRIGVEEFKVTFRQLIEEIRRRVGAHVIVYNTLVIDPLSPTHNYQLANRAVTVRRRELTVALVELSTELDFHVLDLDRVLKEAGVREQVDFAHFTWERMLPVAQEARRILKELEVI